MVSRKRPSIGGSFILYTPIDEKTVQNQIFLVKAVILVDRQCSFELVGQKCQELFQRFSFPVYVNENLIVKIFTVYGPIFVRKLKNDRNDTKKYNH